MIKTIMFFLYSLAGGGAERTVVNILNNLNRQKFKPILVLVTRKNTAYIDLLPDDIEVISLNTRKLRYSLLKLRKCIIDKNPDLLFSTLNPNNIILALANVLSFKMIPHVMREANNRTESGNVTKMNKLITFFTYNYLSKIIVALSVGVKDDLAENFKIKNNKIEVIYNPIEVANIKKNCNELVNDMQIDRNKKTIIAVGRLVEQKDFGTLITAFSEVCKTIKSKLIILGKGPLEKELKDLANQLDIGNKVEFLGFKKNPYKYMKQADIFVLSSRWEGFGHVIVEAMACGTPVIATDCKSGPKEIIGDDEYGMLVPIQNSEALAKAIIYLLNNENKREGYRRSGFKRAKDFEARKIIKQYEDVFFSALKGR